MRWKAEQNCSEPRLAEIAGELALHLRVGDRVWLQGELGAGKSTFARAVLHALGVRDLAEGSPTFSIAHEYRSFAGDVIHLDLYRLEAESEIEDAGVPAYFWEREAIVLAEWMDRFPGFAALAEKAAQSVYTVKISRSAQSVHTLRDLEITRLEPRRV